VRRRGIQIAATVIAGLCLAVPFARAFQEGNACGARVFGVGGHQDGGPSSHKVFVSFRILTDDVCKTANCSVGFNVDITDTYGITGRNDFYSEEVKQATSAKVSGTFNGDLQTLESAREGRGAYGKLDVSIRSCSVLPLGQTAQTPQDFCSNLKQTLDNAADDFKSDRGTYDRDSGTYDSTISIAGGRDCLIIPSGAGNASLTCDFEESASLADLQSDYASLVQKVHECLPPLVDDKLTWYKKAEDGSAAVVGTEFDSYHKRVRVEINHAGSKRKPTYKLDIWVDRLWP